MKSWLQNWLHNLPAIGLLVLLAACFTGWLLTRNTGPANVVKKAPVTAQVQKVDQRLLQTARQLASQADTSAEQELALEAARLADQELDEDFANAIREAAATPPPIKGPMRALAAQIDDFKTRVAADQQRVAQLTKAAATNSAAGDKLALVNAQLALDQDQLEDAQQDLARLGGDPHANLQQALDQHKATQQGPPALAKITTAGPPGTLFAQIQLWLSLGTRQDQINSAKDAASRKASILEQEHNALEGKMGPAPQVSAADSGDDQNTTDDTAEDTTAAVAEMRRLSDQRKTLMDLDKRVAICRQLASVYQSWSTQVADRRGAVVHLLLGSLALVLAIFAAAMIAGHLVRRTLGKQVDRGRRHQSHVIATIAIEVAAALLVVLIVFGAPTQMPTIIGLAGAGLTVVLKDFIVAFFGWFALMGKNGIRLGDWVEINGVGGEVIEIGVLKTVLLEMGNWTNTGHPTGRRVSFMNGYAIEGHYFNFSTAGQWLWDELQVTLPADGDPYRLAEQIRQIVEKETDEEGKQAAEDWERVTKQYGAHAFSARPATDLRPGPTGLIVNVRYITRAPMRYEVKSRLFQAIVELLHKPAAAQPAATPA